MPDEIVPQEETAEETVEQVESVTTNSENAESETAEQESNETSETTEETEAESTEENTHDSPKVVEELKRQRKLRQELEIEVATLRQQVQHQQVQVQPTVTQSDSEEPKIENYDSLEEYQTAFVKYQFKKERDELIKSQAMDKWYANYNKAMREIEDFDYTMKTVRLALPVVALDTIRESDLGPQVAYYLAKNPSEALKLENLSPLAVAREIGKLEAKLVDSKKIIKKNSVSQAPDPIRPKPKAGGATRVDPMDMTDEEFIRMADEKEYGKRSV